MGQDKEREGAWVRAKWAQTFQSYAFGPARGNTQTQTDSLSLELTGGGKCKLHPRRRKRRIRAQIPDHEKGVVPEDSPVGSDESSDWRLFSIALQVYKW